MIAFNPYARLRPGERLQRFPSAPWNEMLDLLHRTKDDRRSLGIVESPVAVMIRNETGTHLTQGQIVEIGGSNISVGTQLRYADNPEQWLTRRIYNVNTNRNAPTLRKPYAVLQETAFGEFNTLSAMARAIIAGETVVRLNLTNSAHRFADVVTGDSAKMTSYSTGGSAYILDTQDLFQTGIKWARVYIFPPMAYPSGPSSVVTWNGTTSIPASGTNTDIGTITINEPGYYLIDGVIATTIVTTGGAAAEDLWYAMGTLRTPARLRSQPGVAGTWKEYSRVHGVFDSTVATAYTVSINRQAGGGATSVTFLNDSNSDIFATRIR